MAIIGCDVTEQITSKIHLFKSIMQQNFIENEFNCEYSPLATIQPGMAIEFTVKGANDLYLNLNNSHLHVLAKITKADGTNIDANTAALINITLRSILREIGLELTGRNMGNTSQLYQYQSHLESLLNFCNRDSRDPSPLRRMDEGHQRAHGCHRSRLEQCRSDRSLRDIREKYSGRAHRSPSSGRVQARTPIPPNINLHMKLMPSKDNFVCNRQRQVKVRSRKITSWLSRASISSSTPRDAASLIARPNKTPVNPRELDVYQHR